MNSPIMREAVAVFDDPERLERAVSDLQSRGVDRADLSFLAREALSECRSGTVQRLADDPAAPCKPVVSDTDLRQGRVLSTCLAATIAAFAAAGITVTTGGAAAAAIAALVAASGAGAVSSMVGSKLAEDEELSLDEQLARGGVLLWVRMHDAETERRYSAYCAATRVMYTSTVRPSRARSDGD